MEHYASFLRRFFIELCIVGTVTLLLLLYEYRIDYEKYQSLATTKPGQAAQSKHHRNPVALLDKGSRTLATSAEEVIARVGPPQWLQGAMLRDTGPVPREIRGRGCVSRQGRRRP
ncbi:hypothetical protein MRX96_013962 [Rhipicephalus microplus]